VNLSRDSREIRLLCRGRSGHVQISPNAAGPGIARVWTGRRQLCLGERLPMLPALSEGWSARLGGQQQTDSIPTRVA